MIPVETHPQFPASTTFKRLSAPRRTGGKLTIIILIIITLYLAYIIRSFRPLPPMLLQEAVSGYERRMLHLRR